MTRKKVVPSPSHLPSFEELSDMVDRFVAPDRMNKTTALIYLTRLIDHCRLVRAGLMR